MAGSNKRAEIACNVKAVDAAVRAAETGRPLAERTLFRIRGERGLLLAVYPKQKRASWLIRYQVGKGAGRQQRTRTLGSISDVSLAEARAARADLTRTLAKGEDPTDPKTFGELFTAWLNDHAKKKLATWEDEERRYELHLKDAIASKLVAQIERKDVREIRDEVLENAGPIQSNRVVALFNRVMNWAVDEDRAKFNPAARLKKVGEEQRRERILMPEELKRIWTELDRALEIDQEKGGLTEADLKAAMAVRRALKLLVLTGQRRKEVIGIRKAEIDLGDGDAWWTIPPTRVQNGRPIKGTKNGLPHRVPLTPMAVRIVKEAIEASGESEFLFPSTRVTENAPIRPDAVTKQLQRICRRMTPKIDGVGPHDIRRTIGTTMRRLGVSVEDRSYVFNHVSGAKSKVTSWNYDVGEHDDEKRAALEKWERELRRIVGLDASRVIELRRSERIA